MAKELDIGAKEDLFASSIDSMIHEGKRAAQEVLKEIGGIPKLVERFPADRGDANSALIALLLKLASAIEKMQPDLSDRFHAAAIELSASVSEPGSRLAEGYLASHEPLMSALRDAWRSTQHSGERNQVSLEKGSLAFSLGEALARVRILVVHASPIDEAGLRVSAEVRAIREAIQLAGRQYEIEIDDLPAATTDDLRRALLSKEYEIIHFAGHANSESIVLEARNGASSTVRLSALIELLGRYRSVRCVVLNACESLASLTVPIAPFTIGMEESVDDQAAIEFAVGFYDAVARGRDIEFAVAEGKDAARLKGLDVPTVKLLKRT